MTGFALGTQLKWNKCASCSCKQLHSMSVVIRQLMFIKRMKAAVVFEKWGSLLYKMDAVVILWNILNWSRISMTCTLFYFKFTAVFTAVFNRLNYKNYIIVQIFLHSPILHTFEPRCCCEEWYKKLNDLFGKIELTIVWMWKLCPEYN